MDIRQGDCFDLIESLKDNSIDCIITDPPYFLHKLDTKWEVNGNNTSKVITKLPSMMRFDSKQGKNFEDFMYRLSEMCMRKLKPGGFFLAFSSPRLYHGLARGMERAGFEIRDQLCWKYKTSQAKAARQTSVITKDKIMSVDEKKKLILQLENYRTPQARPLFEPICLAMKPVEGRFIDNWMKWKTGLMYVPPGEPVPATVLSFSKPNREERSGNPHPTVKPVALMEYLIRIYCPPQGRLLDPFLGSGTTAVAAKNVNGRYSTKIKMIGFEKNSDYIKIINSRIHASATLTDTCLPIAL